ncbi:MAG TPA: extracellular solute-binding protein [Stellaceae bacterium]|nr:extracellular solute-binding protein [Stellaceae bacterium]
MNARSKTAGLRVLAFAMLVLCAASVARAETLAQLYEKAKAEKSLVFYSGGPVEPYERWAKEFEARFPGIEVSVTGGFSNVLDSKINQQLAAKKLEVDMAILQTVQDFVGWKKRGALLRFKPEGFSKIDRRFRDEDGAFMSTTVVLLSYAYNTKLVPANEVPKSALDFLKPQFRGKLVTAYPADDDATLFVFDDIVKKYGWGYMKKYMANQPTFIQGHLGVLRSIADGKNAVTFDSTSSTTAALKQAGNPIEFAFPTDDAMPVFFITAGIFKLAPHPNAAKLFLTWYLAKEQQSRLGGSFSSRTDVPPPAGMKPLKDLKIDAGYRQFVTNEKRLVALRKRFEAFTGPVVNKGGVR